MKKSFDVEARNNSADAALELPKIHVTTTSDDDGKEQEVIFIFLHHTCHFDFYHPVTLKLKSTRIVLDWPS